MLPVVSFPMFYCKFTTFYVGILTNNNNNNIITIIILLIITTTTIWWEPFAEGYFQTDFSAIFCCRVFSGRYFCLIFGFSDYVCVIFLILGCW